MLFAAPMGGDRHYHKLMHFMSTNHNLLVCRFWWNLVQLCIWALQTPSANKILRIQQFKAAAVAILKNRKLLIPSQSIVRLWRNLACWCVSTVSQKKFVNSTIQDGGSRHLEKSKNVNIFTTDRPILMKFGMLISKIQDGGCGHFENLKNCNISATEWSILMKFVQLCVYFHNRLTNFDKIWHADAC